ncbi:MAG: hypothetical protein JNK15_09555 [Planctomycetes bacterium]|nr:hypothetical protein [Planctomycetota bacterium]
MRPPCSVLLLCAVAAAGCHNYDFATARLPNGELDTKKLIADLQASGRVSLSDGFWIPLVHCDITTFGPSKSDAPTGYTFGQLQAYGPVFCVGGMQEAYFTATGEPAGESRDRRWLGWGIVFHDYEEQIEAKLAPRTRHDWRVALIFGKDDVRYGPSEPTGAK